jgi:hypothetical protein
MPLAASGRPDPAGPLAQGVDRRVFCLAARGRRTRKRARAFILGVAALWSLVLCATVCAQVAPRKYQALYRDLDGQLAALDVRVPGAPGGKLPIRAATLLSANCHRGEILLESGTREATTRELDALKNLGAEAIVLQICYPLLTPGYRDPQPFLDYYINLGNEIRARNLKLVVEHGTLQPGFASVDVRPYYKKLTKARFARERYAELKSILVALQPDYVTLVSEPAAQSAGLKLSVKDWRTYVAKSLDALAQELGSFPTLLGAGCGLWEEFEYAGAFAGITRLHYIDLHLYPLTSGGESSIERLLTWPDRIREIDSRKLIVLSELWLYKAGATEKIKGARDPAIVARDAFSFWGPLDQKFLRIVGRAARAKNIELFAPFWSQYFFAYVDYNDPLTFRVNARQLLDMAAQHAYQAILQNQVTETGAAFRRM